MSDTSLTPAPVYRILLISGSTRAGSTNTAALKTACALAPPDASAQLYERLSDLPHFNPDVERAEPPEPVLDLRRQLAASDAVFFSTPEYAGGLPGSFKNLLDWTVGEGLYQKPVGWLNASYEGGALRSYEMLRVVLGYVNAQIVEAACVHASVRRDAIAENGQLSDPGCREVLRAALRALVEHVRRQAAETRDEV